MNLFEKYDREQWQDFEEKLEPTLRLREAFLKRYPVSEINSLTLDEYLFAKKGYGNERSYCRQIHYDFEWISSMGNVWPDVFGIYLRGGNEIRLSKTYMQMFGDDYQSAFSYIKQEITDLIINIGNDQFDALEKCSLNRAFKYKLAVIYYLEKMIPVTTVSTLNQYCDRVGITYNPNEEPIWRNLALKRWFENNPATAKWATRHMMSFADWLWRNDLKITAGNISDINVPKKPADINYSEGVVTCATCGYAFIKAPRCPKCGQLQNYGGQ